jgi:transposase-like protein
MTKHAKKSYHLQLVDAPKTTIVEIPLPLLGALANIEQSFFGLCIDAGQQVLASMMEQDREDLCGARWKRDPDRKAGRAGTTRSEVTLGGRRISIARPRVRSQAGREMELPSFAFAANRDPLDHHTLEAVACGVSTRKYARSLDSLPEGIDERSVSRSSVSRRYVAMTTKQMTTWLTTPLGHRHFPIVMIDGIHLGDHLVLIALGIDAEGKKQVLGLREGDTENGQVAKALLRDLVERGLDPERARLFVTDGAKALRSAIRKVFGDRGVVQRCQLHKQRNILGHLPEGMHESVKAILREAWSLRDAKLAKARLERLASSLETDHPGAAASVREGLEETLTLQGLGIEGTLYRKLRSTNAIENLNSGIAAYSKNVKRWKGGSLRRYRELPPLCSLELTRRPSCSR